MAYFILCDDRDTVKTVEYDYIGVYFAVSINKNVR